MKRKLVSLVMAFALVICSSLSTGVLAHETVPTPLNAGSGARIRCSVCNDYDVALVCNKSKYYSYDYTHKSNGTTCTVIVYESSYKGRFCVGCGAESKIPFDYTSRHPCTEKHSSCGRGTVNCVECLHNKTGTVMPEV